MADLTAFADPIAAAVFAHYEDRDAQELPRPYLGASIIGQECERALWYAFRWASGKARFEGRMLRLFQTGHLAEARFVADLRAIGCTVYDADDTGRQFGFAGCAGHMRGHMDGCGKGIPQGGEKWHVLEFKTHSAKSFAELKRHGVEKAKPAHYAQMQWYMGKSGMDRALYLAVNKDNDDLHSERVPFDPAAFTALEAKAERIIFAEAPPPRISEDPHFFRCKFCDHRPLCHGETPPCATCRTCVHATPEKEGDGRWSCAKHHCADLPMLQQQLACTAYLPLPHLFPRATPTDGGDGWMLMEPKEDAADPFVIVDSDASPPVVLVVEYDTRLAAELCPPLIPLEQVRAHHWRITRPSGEAFSACTPAPEPVATLRAVYANAASIVPDTPFPPLHHKQEKPHVA